MTPQVQIVLIQTIPIIITAIVSLIGAISATLALRRSNENHKEIKATNKNVDFNNLKTDEVGKAVNGRMSAFLEEMKLNNKKTLEEACKATRLEAERVALIHITELKNQIAQAKSGADTLAAVAEIEARLLASTDPLLET